MSTGKSALRRVGPRLESVDPQRGAGALGPRGPAPLRRGMQLAPSCGNSRWMATAATVGRICGLWSKERTEPSRYFWPKSDKFDPRVWAGFCEFWVRTRPNLDRCWSDLADLGQVVGNKPGHQQHHQPGHHFGHRRDRNWDPRGATARKPADQAGKLAGTPARTQQQKRAGEKAHASSARPGPAG